MVIIASWPRFFAVSLFIIFVSIGFYFLGPRLNLGVHRMISSQRVAFEVPKDKIKSVLLKNGLQVIAFQNNLKPKVLMQVCYNVGSANESSSERGLAHLIEHMIFKGTDKLSETDINAISRKYGATTNASTSYDFTNYYFETDKENWEPFLEILADCMTNAKFDDQALASELKAVVSELNLIRDNHLKTMSQKAFEILFPPNHPYHFPVIGFKEELANLNGSDLKKFYKENYHPSNAVLFIIGDINLENVLEVAKNIFEDIPPKDITEEDLSQNVPVVLKKLDEVSINYYEDVKSETLLYFWPLPGLSDCNEAAMQISNRIFSEDKNSILYKRLVDKEGIALDVSSFSWSLKLAGVGFIVIKPKFGMAKKCEDILREELERFSNNLITPEELGKYIPTSAKDFIVGQQNFHSLCYDWMKFYFSKGQVLEYFDYINKLYDLTPKDILKVYRDNFQFNNLKKIHLLPLAEDQKELWSKNNKLILEQEQKILKTHIRTTTIEDPSFVHSLPDAKISHLTMPNPTEVLTINGIKTVFFSDGKQPITRFVLKFKDFEYLDHSMQKDISAMMQLLAEGSVGISKQVNLDFLDAMGADLSFSKSGIICEVLEANFLPVLERIFYMIKNPTFRKNSFEKIRDIMLESLKKAETDPSTVAGMYFWKNHFSGTVFDYGFEDLFSQIKNLTIKDIVSAHDKMSPSSIILGVTGSFNSEKVKTAISKLTKNWKQDSISKELIMPKISHEVIADVDIELLRDQTLFYLGSVSDVSIDDPDYAYLILARYIAFVGFDSRMFKIREQTGLFYSYSGGFGMSPRKNFSEHFVKTKFSPSNLVAGENAIRSMLDDLLLNGITQEELDGAKRSYYCTVLEQCSNNLLTTISFMKKIAQNIPLELSQEVFDKIFNATVEDVNQAFRKHFKPELMTRIRVGTMPKNNSKLNTPETVVSTGVK